jgi:hypothetical protein
MQRPAQVAAAFALLTIFATATAHAQSPSWVALDAQPQGTPATVVFNAALSSQSTSVLDVTIHGFWSTQKTGTDGRIYQSLEVPGLPNKAQHGAPNLPVARFDLGLTNGADVASLQPPIVFASQSLPGYLVWPAPFEVTMEDPEVFQRDEAIYSTPGPWPANNGGSSIHNLLGFLPTASCETYPFHWDPISGLLTVATSVRYQFVHNGPGTALPLTTAAQRNVASNLLANWQTVGSAVAVDNTTYSGYYLIITPQVYQTSLQPLVDQKKARGLKVTELFVEDIGAACQSIRNAIGNWYNPTPKAAEHYCLLVGDVSEVPICSGPGNDQNPFGVPSDDPYGAPFVLNNDRQVMVGRLSPIGPADLDQTVAMLLAYEDHPLNETYYGDVLLVAHGGIFGNNHSIPPYQEQIRTASYITPPSFYTYYGNVVGNTNAGLKSNIENFPRGIIDYFGHGSQTAWSQWDVTGEDFTSSWVSSMSLWPRNPIVWSIACQSGAIQIEDSFGEAWMHRYSLGGLAFYGSTVSAGAWASIELNQDLFFAVFSQDIRIQGYTYYDAEYRMENVNHSNDSWKYLLIGDPEMTIRTTQPPSPWVVSPWVEHVACGPGGCPEIRMLVTQAGAPASGFRAAVYQPGGPGGVGVQDNRYTDATGYAAIPAPGLGDGPLYITTMNTMGHSVPDTIMVQGGQVTGVGTPRAADLSSLRAIPSVVRGGTMFALGRPAHGPARVDLYDAIGRRVRSLPIASGAVSVQWNAEDSSGQHAASGVYLASFHDSEGQAKARVVVLR